VLVKPGETRVDLDVGHLEFNHHGERMAFRAALDAG